MHTLALGDGQTCLCYPRLSCLIERHVREAVSRGGHLTTISIHHRTHTKNTEKGVLFNTRQGTVLTHVLGVNWCYFEIKGIFFYALKCDAKPGHLLITCKMIEEDGVLSKR